MPRHHISEADLESIRELYVDHTARIRRTKGADLKAADVQWVINDNGELGVKIGDLFFWLYKGESIRQQYADMEDPAGLRRYRRVGKREFGEVCRPQGWTPEDNARHEWNTIPDDPARLEAVREWVDTYLPMLSPQEHELAVEQFAQPHVTLREGGYYEFLNGTTLTVAHVADRRSN